MNQISTIMMGVMSWLLETTKKCQTFFMFIYIYSYLRIIWTYILPWRAFLFEFILSHAVILHFLPLVFFSSFFFIFSLSLLLKILLHGTSNIPSRVLLKGWKEVFFFFIFFSNVILNFVYFFLYVYIAEKKYWHWMRWKNADFSTKLWW